MTKKINLLSFSYKTRQFARSAVFAAAIGVFATSLPAPAQSPGNPNLRSVAEVPETPFEAAPGTWTLVVLPDTQFYSKWYPEIFMRQTEWIVKNKNRHNIRFAVHLGDITNNNGNYEWRVPQRAMKVLKTGKVPYSLVPGNHDTGDYGKTDSRDTYMNKYFSEADYANNAAYGLFEPGKMENSWHHLEAPTGKYLILALEYLPRNEVLDWANDIVRKNPDRKVILTTHSYVGRDKDGNPLTNRIDVEEGKSDPLGSTNGGKEMWEKLVSQHPNFIMTLNGHIHGRGYRASKGAGGQTVHQMLSDYQDGPNDPTGEIYSGARAGRPGYGGGGYLRLLQFSPDGKTVHVKSYSPWYDNWLTEPAEDFTIKW